ncbi:MAG: ribose 5-phosphate isomerase B [Saprospiraceae bacterium]|nr:ribose 5-phosphate isomerase B [Saprospiraceae bacterium]MBK8450500.1 ribose 5-phosphate isomerase B [Saprospiraceae bacterium]
MKISIGADHAGFEYKNIISNYLEERGIEVTDHGSFNTDSVDYPDFIHPVANDISEKRVDFGIVICGSGNGAAMTANKHAQVRCALCWNEEIASLARLHNDANILSIPSRFVSEETAIQMVETFLSTPFEGGRHQRRVEKMNLK